MTTMKEALQKAGVPLTEVEESEECAKRVAKQRTKAVLERPTDEVNLQCVREEPFQPKKFQSDPTSDLTEIKRGTSVSEFRNIVETGFYALVWCNDTMQTWVVPTKLCMDQNFIYREDLKIIHDKDEAIEFYIETGSTVNVGYIPRLTCYILDCPADEHYEVYYDTNYPSMKYGKATPNGMFIHKCRDRFHRDMRILELDQLYYESSRERASQMVNEPMSDNEAIVVSDGCFMSNVCSSAYYYIDSVSLVRMVQGIIPTEPSQAVLIAEVSGATAALEMCKLKGKRKITYYYDNTSILNVLRNRKTEYIEEIVKYKKLLELLDSEGYDIKFVELHPKTGEDRIDANRALMFFHNGCDTECQSMTQIFTKDYRTIAQMDKSEGKTYKQAKQEFKPKGRPGTSNGSRGVQHNVRNGNNRHGRVF